MVSKALVSMESIPHKNKKNNSLGKYEHEGAQVFIKLTQRILNYVIIY